MEIALNLRSGPPPSSDLWRNVLTQVPTVFGRLVFLAGLREPHNGRYSHPVLARIMGPEQVDRTLCHSHHQVFQHWLATSLQDQKADIEEYLGSGSGARSAILRYRDLIPLTARDVERQLYLCDLETLLEFVTCGQGGDTRNPAA